MYIDVLISLVLLISLWTSKIEDVSEVIRTMISLPINSYPSAPA